jgi:quercetin dioxygenase-like cupin family protein
VAKFAGKTDWERHPLGAEIVQIIEGTTILHLADAAGRQTLSLSALSAGMMAIVPENTWHSLTRGMASA